MNLNPYRSLSVDDLYIMDGLGNGLKVGEIARQLSLTQSAVSQRLQKISALFADPLFQKSGRSLALTNAGRDLATRSTQALSVLDSSRLQQTLSQPIMVGTRPEVGFSWLSKALFSLRHSNPELCFHLKIGSGEEGLKGLQADEIDVLLTSAPVTLREYDSVEVAQEDYVFVARKEIHTKIQSLACLEKLTLIEHDRSFPFLRYLDGPSRAKLKLLDTWFLGSTTLMMQAILEGLGVGIVPLYMAESHMKSGAVDTIDLFAPPSSDSFRLIYRKRPALARPLQLLSDSLRQIGLKPADLTDRNSNRAD